ncbi:abscisic acid ABA receptor [Colletotrichum plurivorum]|uniref:Abscisic acid ABA receptor n=1 Tax=Colletotrichum plurivorum TaxID=2175906 RepID=A0A8H6N6D5_9PEZI|nr:abscisic acid ABA receptor [Colletotrichum plurivorum]
MSLETHLSRTLTTSPPQSSHLTLTTPLTSHVGTSYLFLAISALHPRLQIHSYPARHWAVAYVTNIPSPSASSSILGLTDALSGVAVRAAISSDLSHVRHFLSLLTAALGVSESLPTCLLHGLAGTLYLLRLIRHWVPSSAPLVSRSIVQISEHLLSSPWSCPDSSSGVDGELGTLTQLVLTSPPLAPRLVEKLADLLRLQQDSGTWPSEDAPPGFASGAAGLVISLLSLRPFFPSLHEEIDAVLARGRDFLYRSVDQAPANLWDGVLGMTLLRTKSAFPKGPSRDHLLSRCTPDSLPDSSRGGADAHTPPSESGSVASSYDPGAAWLRAVCDRDMPRMIFYNDI